MSSFFSRPRGRQPQGIARINRAGLGAGVQMLLLPVGGNLIDVANNRVWTRGGNASAGKPTTNGVAATFDGVDDFFSFTGYPEIVGNVGTFFLWLPRIGAYDTNGHVYLGTNTGNSVWFQANTVNVFSFSAGMPSVSGIPDSRDRSLVFTSRGTAATKEFFLDGIPSSSGGLAEPVAFSAGNKTFRFGAWVAGDLFDCDMDCVVAGFTTRTWSDAQARAFHENPWQLFESEPVRIFAPGAAPSGFQPAWARGSNIILGGALA